MKEIHRGKVKTVFACPNDPNEIMIKFEDKVTAGNGEKEDNPEDKGSINCQISTIIFKELEKAGIATHYVDTPFADVMRCKKVNIVPLEVVVRNLAAGSIVRQTTIKKGRFFHPPLVEFYLKDDKKNDPLLTPDRLKIMEYDPEPFIYQALRINEVLLRLFSRINLDLVDFKLEFGWTHDGELLLADEISPDSCRLWKAGTSQSMDKDLFRNDCGDIINAYKSILLDLQGTYNE